MQRRIRVGVVAQAFVPVLGGAQRQVEALGPLLEREGLEVSIVTRRPPGTAPRERRSGLDVRRVWTPRSRPAAALSFTLLGAWAGRGLCADVLYAQDLLSSSSAALLAGRATATPVVVKLLSTGPGGDIDRLLRKPLGTFRLREIIRSAAAFVCLSEEVERELLAAGAESERLARIPNGVDSARFRPPEADERRRLRARLRLPAEETVFLYCGRFAAVKRLDLLLEAFRQVPGRLVLAGEGDQEATLRGMIDTDGLAQRVTVLDTLSDPAPLYQAADAYVSASSTEGMSNSVLEAMSSALPIVALPASGMRELLGDAGGSIAGAATPAALAAEMRRLIAEPGLRARLGGAGRQRVIDRFSLRRTAERLALLFDSVADRDHSAPR